MRDIIDRLSEVVLQIATPLSRGTGFYISGYDVIVTNHHVVAGAKEVIIAGKKVKKLLAPVVYNDTLYDLAFIKLPQDFALSQALLGKSENVREGDEIITIGHPFGLKYTSTRGIISKTKSNYNGVDYFQIDAPINPGNSGGPLIDTDGNIIGVNTFIIRDGNSLGFALPVSYLETALKEYTEKGCKPSVRCNSCSNLVTIDSLENDYCPECGNKINKEIYEGVEYLASKTGALIEEMLTALHFDVSLCRTGPDTWELEKGSAKIKLSYISATKFVVADAKLGQLPKTNLGPLYEFMLKKNAEMENLVFSIDQRDIYLSLLIFEDDFHVKTAADHFIRLMDTADRMDDILIQEYGCLPVNPEENM